MNFREFRSAQDGDAFGAPGNGAPAEHRLMVLMFTDLVNSSGLKSQLGDVTYARAIASPHNRIFRELLRRLPGAEEINYTGDGFLANFKSVSDAVETALFFHQALRDHAWEAGAVRTRIGIHVGQAVMIEGGDAKTPFIASHAADMCSRLMSLGLGGQTLLTRHAFDDARQYVRAHPATPGGAEPPPIVWAAHGRYRFKGRDDDPMEVFEVGAVGFAPLAAPPDGEKAKRVLNADEEETLGWRPAADVEIPGKPGWVVKEKLGEGGFGEVWLARQRKTSDQRVFKFCFDPDRLRSLKRELTIFRLIRESLGDREDIARLHDVRLNKPPFYLESDFVTSGNLSEWAERKGGIDKIPLDARLVMMSAICRAVAAAHSVGVIHKDIKPSNVLIREGAAGHAVPVLADFGIGIVTDQSQFGKLGITNTGFTMSLVGGNDSSRTGTRMYSPPESLVGKAATVQGDVFALGVLLYQFAIGDLQRPLATGWEKDVSDPVLRDDIAAATSGRVEERLRDVASLIDRLAAQPERRKKMRRAQLLKKTAVGLAAAAVVAIVATLGKDVLQKGKIHRLNTQIQQRIDAGTLAEKDVAETDRLIAELAQVSTADAEEQRRRVTERIASVARSAIQRANLADADQQQIESWLALLQPRDPARTAQLRADLAGRLREWEPAFALKPPFDKAADLGGHVAAAANEVHFSGTQVALPVDTQGATRVEADFGSLKEARGAIGFAFEDEQKRAYTFSVTPPLKAMRTKYTLDLDAPGFAERLQGWVTPSPENTSISLAAGKALMRLERPAGNLAEDVRSSKVFYGRRHAGKVWIVSWRSRTSGFSTSNDGAQLQVTSIDKDGKRKEIAGSAYKQNGDWSANSKTFPIPPEAARLTIDFRLFSKANGAFEIADFRITERNAAEQETSAVEVYSMPPVEWHPATNDVELWMPSCDGRQLELLTEKGRKFLRFSNEPGAGYAPQFHRFIKIEASMIKSVTLSARVRAPSEIVNDGTSGWRFPKVYITPLDRNGKWLPGEQSVSVTKQSDWKTLTATMKSVPLEAVRFDLGIAIWSDTKGAIDVSDLKCEIEPAAAHPGPGKENQVRLAILRGPALLSESFLPLEALAGESIRVAAERVGNSLRLQAGQQRPLEVFDPFPIAAQNFHPVLLTTPDQSVRSIAIYRQRLPEKPQPLELGDEQFFAGNQAGALAAYEAQLPTATDPATRVQARFKIGLCLLQQKRDKEAEAHFVEAAGANTPPWSGLASCQLLALYLGQRRVVEADAVLAALRVRPDFEVTLGNLTNDLTRAIYRGYNNFGRNVLESGDQNERLATIERLQRLLEVANLLHVDAPNQYLLQFEICRLYAVTGQNARAIDYSVEQVAAMEKEGFPSGGIAGLFSEVYFALMAKSGHSDLALPMLQKWDELAPNQFTAIQLARCLIAMKRLDEAEAKLAGVIGNYFPFRDSKIPNEWIYAVLLRGLIAEMRGGPEAGRASWAAAFRELRDAVPNHDPAAFLNKQSRPNLFCFIMLGGLSGELKDEDMPSLRRAITNTYAELGGGEDSARLTLYKSAPALFSKQDCLSFCTGERGSAFARNFIRGDLVFFEAYRMPFIFMMEELFIRDSIGHDKISAEQEALYWRFSEALNDTLRDKHLSSAQMLGLLAAWKGVTNIYGWQGVQAQLPPALRSPLAYVMGQRYLKLERKEDAADMFRAAIKDAAQLQDGAPVAALAETALKSSP